MKLENGNITSNDKKMCDTTKYRTRMKKVAPPPPPPPPVVAKPPPLSNGSALGRRTSSGSGDQQQQPRPPLSTTPGEDCAIDELLEGRMELEVVLPDCKVVRMTVDRRTPMMDLLVQATTSNKISPSGHIINVISKDERNVSYKPNTPIGSLDANTVYIIPKSALELPIKRMPKLANQPFEQTFRLQVNLPHNQRMVLRVSPRITLAELKNQICSEKELDHSSHHLVHPAQPDTVLDLNATLEVYGCAEISLMSNSGLRDSIRSTSTNLFAYPRIEEEKKKKGILRLFSRKKKELAVETPSNGVNYITSSQSESATLNRNSYQPKQSLKRKPAPAPPLIRNSSPPLITQSTNSINSRPESEISVKTADEVESSVSHSRHSSDSSGYHEPSVFSDCSENKSPETSVVHGDHVSVNDANRQESPLHKDYSDSVLMKRSSMTTKDTNLKNVPSCSNVSIISASRKRKAPQPPVSTLPAIESPSSPDAPPLDIGNALHSKETLPSEKHESELREENVVGNKNASLPVSVDSAAGHENVKSKVTVQQESEALQYLEDVLQESENSAKTFPSPKTMDDSDTDSQKDEGEVISVCQAEIHADANEEDSSDSVVEPHTVVTPDPKSSFAPLSNPNSQSAGYEDSADPSLVPSNVEFPAQSECISNDDSLDDYANTVTDGALSNDVTDPAPYNDPLEVIEEPQKSPIQRRDQEIGRETSPLLAEELESADINKSAEISTVESKALQSNESKDFRCDPESRDQNSAATALENETPSNGSTLVQQSERKLENFALGCYKKDSSIDIFSTTSTEPNAESAASNHSVVKNLHNEKKDIEVPTRKFKNQPDVKIVSFPERSGKGSSTPTLQQISHGNVLQKCAQLNNISTLPLTGRSSSLYNLTPQRKIQKTVSEKEYEEPVNGNMKRTQSDQNFVKELEPVELKICFLEEQKRLQEEYRRLQAQFLSWQKQLLCNQNLLQNENILPQMPFAPFESFQNLEDISEKSMSESQVPQKSENVTFDDFKTRSLPRPKTKPLSLKESARPKTPPVPQSPTEASVVNIDIGAHEHKRPDSLTSCSVDTQANIIQEDKVTQIPSPQDKVVQVPSPQEKVTSGTQVPSPENSESKEDVSAQTSNHVVESAEISRSTPSLCSLESENSKSQTLPRPKPKPVSAFQPSRTMTLNRNTRPKSQVVSVTIGSWQQRQTAVADIEPSSVASSRSKFQSLENIPQTSSKSVSSSMEKRKLPPVPTEVKSSEKNATTVNKSLELVSEYVKTTKVNKDRSKPSEKTLHDEHKNVISDEKPSKTVSGTSSLNTKVQKTGSKPSEGMTAKQKTEIKLASKEPSAFFKSGKPFVKLSSMKDESHPPSIIGLRKWPLSDISENSGAAEGKQSALDDLRTGSRRPAGFVQDKIRRAEVDLRKPKSSKTDSATSPKTKDITVESSKLHITKVNINNSKDDIDSNVPVQKIRNHASNVTTPVTGTENTSWSNTIPKSRSLNSELMAVFSRKASKDANEKRKDSVPSKLPSNTVQNITVNGSTQAPPPPPPPPLPSSSAMPAIPPAEQIPVSSQLLMGKGTKTLPITKKESKKSPTKISRTTDPREELMLEIRGFGGKQALRKAPVAKTGWHLKVYGTASTANS